MKNSSISCGRYSSAGGSKLAEYIADNFIKPPSCYIHSYGCAQNVSDGEKIKGILYDCGYVFADAPENADLIILNTCAVRENAQDRVLGNVGGFKKLKKENPDLIICICGCMTQQQTVLNEIEESYRHVDIVFGTYGAEKLPDMIYEVMTKRKRVLKIFEDGDLMTEGLKQLREDTITANLPIMYGCNNFCSYCIVPYVRGRERSREMSAVCDEVRELVANGCKEITLLGQNVNSYGYGFVELLREINAIEGDFRIRFMSSHPKDASFELIDAILSLDKVCKHLHLPVQSGSDEILQKMNRKYTAADYLRIVDYARSKDPEFSFTTDIIVGFPGETYEQFCETKALLHRVKFDNVFSFVYSKRSGTKAAELEDKVSDKEKGLMLRELLLEQREITESWLSRFVGKTLTVLPLTEGRTGEGYLSGKSDEGIIVEFEGDRSLIGSFVKVKIIKAMNWALLGEI